MLALQATLRLVLRGRNSRKSPPPFKLYNLCTHKMKYISGVQVWGVMYREGSLDWSPKSPL